MLADYFLQVPFRYMLGKFKPGFGWILPLTAHVAIHGAFTFVIAALFLAGDWGVFCHGQIDCILFIAYKMMLGKAAIAALLDMSIHFVMDRIKASPKLLGRYKALSASEMGVIIENFRHYQKDPASPTTRDSQQVDERKLKANVYFWYSLGLDQMVHHLTHYAVIYYLLRCL